MLRFFSLLTAVLTLSGAPAGAEEQESYWGPIEEPNESNTATLESPGKAGWEKAVDLPYRVAFFPLKIVTAGLEETVGFAQSDFAQRVLHFFPLKVGPTYLSAGIGVGSQDGFGANVSLDVPDFLREEGFLKLRLDGTTKGKGKATLGVIYPRTDHSWVQVGGGYRSDLNARFHGLGASRKNQERKSFHREEMAWIGASYKRKFGSTGLSYEIGANYSGVSANGTPDSNAPALSGTRRDDKAKEDVRGVFEEELASGSIPELSAGYRDRSDGPTVSLEIAHDNTTMRDRPDRGGLRRAKVSHFQERGDDQAEFLTYRAELQQFIPLWHTSRALAVRAFYAYLDNIGDDPIPFQRLLTNDDPDVFRGYNDYRFRDHGMWAATAEYRWPVWSNRQIDGLGIDAYGFVDIGQVFGPGDNFDTATDDITTSYGGGIRFGGFGQFIARLEIGTSEEDTVIRLRADQLFQFEKGGLFHGRNPVPER